MDIIIYMNFFIMFQNNVSAVNPLVAFYDIHGRKREEVYFS
jgi:hypothetical protein